MASRRQSPFKKLIFGLVALLCGGGTGLWGWLDPDAPLVGAVLQKLRGSTTGSAASASPLLSILPQRDPFVTAGVFEVSLAKATVDAAELRAGHHVDLQAKISKKTARGELQLIWDSRYAGDRISVVGKEPVSASWADKPFQVTWNKGEDFVVEVWDRKAIFDKTLFILDTTSGDREFPLRPDTTTFTHTASGRRTAHPANNSVRFESKRVADAQ